MKRIGSGRLFSFIKLRRSISALIAIIIIMASFPLSLSAEAEEVESEIVTASSEFQTLRFDFGGGEVEPGYIGVSASCAYSSSKKYGFTNTAAVEDVTASGTGALADAVRFTKVSGHVFNVDLEAGVYKITVTTGDVVSTTITAEGYQQLFFMTGNNAVDSFTIPVTDGQLNIYAGSGIDDTPFSISAIEIEQISKATTTKPTIYIAGDATAASYYNVADDSLRGWGQYLDKYIDPDDYDVRNLSINDVKAKELITCGAFNTAEHYGKSGDILILAVGINDYISAYLANNSNPDATGYIESLTTMITRAKAKGMRVYLVKQHGELKDCAKYPLTQKKWFSDAIDTVAAAEQVEILDLFNPWLVFCLENTAMVAYKYYTEDGLHLNASGAEILAKMVAAQLFPEPVEEKPVIDDTGFDTADTIIYQTEISGGPVKNPHKGFVMTTYQPYMIDSSMGFEYGIDGSANNGAWDVVTICNGAIYWKDINPEEGVYDWEYIDKMLEACWAQGMTYIIRILPYSHLEGEHDNYGADHDFVPEWVYKKGAKKQRVTLVENPSIELDVPVWDDEYYLDACRQLAKALADKYDGDPRVELIDIRPFGNWGEWHFSQVKGSEMPSVAVQEEMIKYYADVFDETLLAITSNAYGEVYDYALSLGITKRNDGMIASSNEEWDMRKAYYAGLPAVAENAGTYSMMLKNSDAPYGPLKWTTTRFRECIEIGHLSITALDQDSHCGYEFYLEQKEVIDEMCNRIGYNYTVTSAKRNGNRLKVTIKNTGVAPSYFNIEMCAEITDAEGKKLGLFGNPVKIEKGTFMDDTEQTFIFEYSGTLADNAIICLAMYECDNKLLQGKDPSVRFDNKNNLDNNKLLLVEQNRKYLISGYSLDITDGCFLLNIYADYPESYGEYSVKLELPDGSITGTKVKNAKTVMADGKNYQVFPANVAAKDICNQIKLTLYDASGNAVGGAVYLSVEEYANALKKRNLQYTEFVDAMLLYGSYAKAYFNSDSYDSYSFAKVYESLDYSVIAGKITSGEGISAAGYLGTTLILNNQVILRHYFNKSVGGATYKDGLYYVEKTFNPSQFGQTIAGYDYSVNDYIKNVLCSDKSAALKNLVSALYEYEEAANKLKTIQ